MEYLCLIAEIEALKEENARLCQTITGKNVRKIHANPQKVVKSICSCLNMRGNPCKRKCLEGKDHCEKHDPSVQKVVKSICSCLNMRGNPCKRKCLEGKDHCEKHDPSVQKVVKSICSCLNMRGNPCKRKCLEGKDHCEKHDPSVQKPRVKPTGSKVYIEQLVPWDKTKWVSELEFWTARNEPRMI
jgi:hypothetical protein